MRTGKPVYLKVHIGPAAFLGVFRFKKDDRETSWSLRIAYALFRAIRMRPSGMFREAFIEEYDNLIASLKNGKMIHIILYTQEDKMMLASLLRTHRRNSTERNGGLL